MCWITNGLKNILGIHEVQLTRLKKKVRKEKIIARMTRKKMASWSIFWSEGLKDAKIGWSVIMDLNWINTWKSLVLSHTQIPIGRKLSWKQDQTRQYIPQGQIWYSFYHRLSIILSFDAFSPVALQPRSLRYNSMFPPLSLFLAMFLREYERLWNQSGWKDSSWSSLWIPSKLPG